MNALRLLFLGVCAAAIGCNSGPQQSRGVHQVSWSISTPDHPAVPGLDKACVLFATYGDSAAMTFWTDGPGGSFGAGYEKSREAVHYSGSVMSQDARKIKIDAFTTDGSTGDVTIDGQKFELTQGSLFLIKTADGKTQILQLALKIPEPKRGANPQTESGSEALREFAKSHRQISEFFETRDEGRM